MADRGRRDAVQSVDRAVSILEMLSRSGWSGVTEVARGLGVHKSTAYRLLATLRERGLVEQDGATERYRLGVGVLFLARAVTAELDIVQHARPVCQRLSDDTGETVTLTVLAGDEAVIIFQATSAASALGVDWTGRHTPLHCTSDGKVLLAHLPVPQQRRLLSRPLRAYTPDTIVDPAQLALQLESIRANGYSYTAAEFEIGLNGVAVPICGAEGTVAAALSVSGPAVRLPVEAMPMIARLAQRAGEEIARRLGAYSRVG